MPIPNLGLEPEELDESITGLEGQSTAVIDIIAGVQQYNSTRDSGNQTILPLDAMLGRAADAGIAPGVAADDIPWGLDQFPFEIRRFVGYSTITDDDEVALEGVNIPAATTILKRAMIESVAKQDKRFAQVISDTGINTAVAVNNGAWTLESSTPWADLIEARRKSNYGDTLVLGADVLDALQIHPDTGARFLNAQGAIGEGEVVGELRRVLGLNVAIVGPRAYNTAVPGQSVGIGYQFDGIAWIGHAKSFIVVNKKSLHATETARDIRREASAFRYTRRRSIGRAYPQLGAIITGVIA